MIPSDSDIATDKPTKGRENSTKNKKLIWLYLQKNRRAKEHDKKFESVDHRGYLQGEYINVTLVAVRVSSAKYVQ